MTPRLSCSRNRPRQAAGPVCPAGRGRRSAAPPLPLAGASGCAAASPAALHREKAGGCIESPCRGTSCSASCSTSWTSTARPSPAVAGEGANEGTKFRGKKNSTSANEVADSAGRAWQGLGRPRAASRRRPRALVPSSEDAGRTSPSPRRGAKRRATCVCVFKFARRAGRVWGCRRRRRRGSPCDFALPLN